MKHAPDPFQENGKRKSIIKSLNELKLRKYSALRFVAIARKHVRIIPDLILQAGISGHYFSKTKTMEIFKNFPHKTR